MRVIVDANVWISYLLTQGHDSTIAKVVGFILSSDATLIMPSEIETEIRHSVSRKSYLASRIRADQLDRLLERIRLLAIIPPSLELPNTSYVSDRKDDYLIAYGLLYNCEYLVTGDGVLLALKRLRGLTIVDPAEFWSIVER